MGQHSSSVENTANIHPKDLDRMMVHKYNIDLNDITFEKWAVFKNKYAVPNMDLHDLSLYLGLSVIKTNNPNLVAKLSHTRSEYLAWQQFNLMKCSNILYYTNVFKRKSFPPSYCFVMEKLDYTLTDYVTKQFVNIVIDEELTKLIIFDLLNCLYLIHSLHFIHTDIKPDNIMYRSTDFIGNDGVLYKKGWVIIDYDIMIQCHNVSGPKFRHWLNYGCIYEIEATAGWTQPEMAKAVPSPIPPKISFSADLWSIGLVILFILFKKQPLKRKPRRTAIFKLNPFTLKLSEKELIKYLLDLKHSHKVSYDLYNLLRGLLNYDPTKRMQSVQEVYNSPWFDSVRNTNINGENIKNIL